MNNEQRAAKIGLTRQGYELRLKTWVEMFDGKGVPYLVNPNQRMLKPSSTLIYLELESK